MLKFIKTTIIGGLLFLIPFIVLVIILTKVYDLSLVVAKPMGDVIPLDQIGGVGLADILVVLMIGLVCFSAGVLAKGKYMKKLQSSIESNILMKIPGYQIVNTFIDGINKTEEASANFNPIIVAFDDYEMLCFEIEKVSNNKTVVYQPGAPTPWSGAVLYIENARIKHLNISVQDALRNIQSLGLGTNELMKKKLTN